MAHLRASDLIQLEREHTFELNGVVYKLPADPPVETIEIAQYAEDQLPATSLELGALVSKAVKEGWSSEQLEEAAAPLTRKIALLGEAVYQETLDLLREANPEMEFPTGDYLASQRQRFADATGLDFDRVTDTMLEDAGVPKRSGLRLTPKMCMRIVGLVAKGEPGLVSEAVTEALGIDMAELAEDAAAAEADAGLPPTKPQRVKAGVAPRRSRTRSQSRSSR